jgi:flavin reductase (DIM6/NTAB) family NADH-FMN oxidoreductase RutF
MLREQFLEGMSRAACTVSIVTTDGPAGRAGVTVSAMSPVSADTASPSLLVCVHHQSSTATAIRANGVFCVNLLRKEQSEISDIFAGRIKTPSGDKFEGSRWSVLATGSPALAGTLVDFDCTLRKAVRYGSHWILIGELADIALNEPGLPLVYTNRAYGEPIPLDLAVLL